MKPSIRQRTLTTLIGMAVMMLLASCSVNPATGEQQFTALLPPSQEQEIGREKHGKILQRMGGQVRNEALQSYLTRIGQDLAQYGERPEITYRFTVLDTEMVNAFAVPGGYIYITRGLLALARNEAEMASVLAHEIGHITARHSAERYSHAMMTQLGTGILSTAVDSGVLSQALGLGGQLYLSGYSRKQERQADSLGLRYLTQAGYPAQASAGFLEQLQRYKELEAAVTGRPVGGEGVAAYFATHPQTEERILTAKEEAGEEAGIRGARVDSGESKGLSREDYYARIDGMVYGPSPEQGFVRKSKFLHPRLGFQFEIPGDYKVENRPEAVIVRDSATAAQAIFDSQPNAAKVSPAKYVTDVWGSEADFRPENVETFTLHGKRAATATVPAKIRETGAPATLRLYAIEWTPERFYRFALVYPADATKKKRLDLRNMVMSFRDLTSDMPEARPNRIALIKAQPGDTVSSLAAGFPFDDGHNQARFRTLNGLAPDENLETGRQYKVIRG